MSEAITEQMRRAGPATPGLPAYIVESYEHCHRVTRRRARNFYHGMKLTPEPMRSAMYAVYAFMRACDDLADDARPGEDSDAARARIEAFRGQMTGTIASSDGELPRGNVWPAFRHVVRTYDLDAAHFHAMLDGQLTDLDTTRYETFEQLYEYCYKVASVVGLVCVSIWGHDGRDGTMKMAEHRGIALQLTNIIRDVTEDARRGRVYLPAEDMAKFGVTRDDVLAGRASQAFDQLLLYEVQRARGYYESSADLERHIDEPCRPTCWAMMRVYRELLERIARDPRRVLTRRVRLGAANKTAITLRAMWKRSWPAHR